MQILRISPLRLVVSATLIFILSSGCKKTTKPTVGQTYQGGVVFYLDATGEHGLVASTTDITSAAAWGCKGSVVSGAGGTGLNTGNQNTSDIVKSCSDAGTAARLCSDYVSGGFSDWFLPSRDELSLMFQKKDAIGGFAKDQYWSSTQTNANCAWLQDFDTGVQFSTTTKDYETSVRAIRAF